MRYLIVGYGNIGHKRASVLGKKCAATFDPDPKVNADFKKLDDIPLEIFDAAVLTVPQQNKLELTQYFLKNGKHVLVEKPFILTIKESVELLKLAKKNNVILYTSYNHRFEPNIEKIKKLLSNGFPGKLYHGRFVYSFGNIKERIGTWRETAFGVMEEIVPHQLDFIMNFWGYQGKDFKTLIARKVESKIFDHWLVVTTDKKVTVEFSAVTWKNIFSIDIYGEKGSIHMNGLRKWGGSELLIRKRVYPAGIPKEKRVFDQGPDVTWKQDFKFFEKMVLTNRTSLKNDLEMSQAISGIISSI